MKRSIRWYVCVVFLAGLTNVCNAQQNPNTLKKIQETQVIRLGYLEQAIPFSFVDETKKARGYSVELCQRVARGIEQQLSLQKLDVQWVAVTPVNRFEMVTNGSIDLECGTSTITVSRQKIVDFSLMTWMDGGNYLVKAGQPHGGLGDLAGKRIGVIVGTTTETSLREALKRDLLQAELVLVKDHLEGLNAMGQGKADAYASDQTVLMGLASAIREQMPVQLSDRYFSYEPYGFVLRRNDADFKQAVNQALARLYRTGQIGEIYDRWFGKGGGKPSALLSAMYLINGLPE